MATWREKADEMFPELISHFEDADTPYLLWFELREAFEDAYEKTPRDEALMIQVFQSFSSLLSPAYSPMSQLAR